MEGHNHGGINGTNAREKEAVMVAAAANEKRSTKGLEMVLRFLCFVLTLMAAVILGVNKQSKMVAVSLVPNLPPVNVPVTAKWHYLSAFVYFVVANAIACAYAAISFILHLLNKDTNKNLSLMINLFDLVMLALLFSGVGAAMAAGLIGYEGNSHLQWGKVCNVFGKFCSQTVAAMVFSLMGSTLFFILVLFTIWKLRNRRV